MGLVVVGTYPELIGRQTPGPLAMDYQTSMARRSPAGEESGGRLDGNRDGG